MEKQGMKTRRDVALFRYAPPTHIAGIARFNAREKLPSDR